MNIHDILVLAVTEREVRHGIVNKIQSRDHCLAYVRNINNVNTAAVKSAPLFIDMLKTASRIEIDNEARTLLHELSDVLLPSRLAESNITHFDIDWETDEGLDFNTHADYLRQFSETFYEQV